jgi:hypothetical protein
MDDRFTKYSKLYFLIFLLFLAVPVVFGLVMGTFYGFSKLISSRPVDLIFELIVITIPSVIFATVDVIFLKRTKYHPSKIIKIISQVLFIIGIAYCIIVLSVDIFAYFNKRYHNITDYKNFSLLFLTGNIATLFLIAILQAFTTKKEEDWLEKRNKKNY